MPTTQTISQQEIALLIEHVEHFQDMLDELWNRQARADADGNVQLRIKLPLALYDRIVAICTVRNITISTYITEALQEHLARKRTSA